MPHSADCPQGRSQLFTFARRDFLQKAASAALLCFLPRPQAAAATPSRLPRPEFAIGDLVAQDWIDEADKSTDFGEVLGIRYVPPVGEYSSYPGDSWLYYIRWTSTTSGLDYLYPCYDGEPTMASELRLVNHA
jgi:hypothetical protein